MKILFTSDMHGRHELYEQMMGLAVSYQADCILLGGDLLPTRSANLKVLLSADEQAFQVCLQTQFEFIDSYLAPRLKRFMQDHPVIKILYIPGNHDWIAAMEHLQKSLPAASNIHLNRIVLSNVTFSGYACVTDSTFWVKDYVRRDLRNDTYIKSKFALVSDKDRLRFSPEGAYALTRPSIAEELDSFTLPDNEKTICVFHSPPYDTGLDTLFNGKAIGSRSIRSYIESTRPCVSLHGHIHESPYMSGFFKTHIKNTLVINPGHKGNDLHAVTFDTCDPEKTLTHSIFGKGMPSSEKLRSMLDIRKMKIKAFMMDKILKGD